MTTIDIEFLDEKGCLCTCAYPLSEDTTEQARQGEALSALIIVQTENMSVESIMSEYREYLKPFLLRRLDDGLPIYGTIIAVDGSLL